MNAVRNRGSVSAIWRNFLAIIVLSIASSASSAFAQTPHESQHGAHEVFASPDAAIIWAVLKAPSAANSNAEKAAVWLRIVNSTKKFSHFSIDGVDPFSKKRERLQPGSPLPAEARVESDRESFSEFPSREVHFYRSPDDLRAEKPTLTVYYLGVPDQTPEFSTRAAMDNYLSSAKVSASRAPLPHPANATVP